MRIYGTASKEDCFARCSLLKKSGVYANGATVDRKTGKLCYCEFGMSKRNTNKKWTSTFIIRGMVFFPLSSFDVSCEIRSLIFRVKLVFWINQTIKLDQLLMQLFAFISEFIQSMHRDSIKKQ